ncbi:hypothetical protein Q7P37_001816 [Cladosporium fusiforme]
MELRSRPPSNETSSSQHAESAATAGGGSEHSLEMDASTPVLSLSTQDQQLFADRSKLVGEDLLELAGRYSNPLIVNHVNAAAPAGSQANYNRFHLHRALDNAFKARAKETGKAFEEVKAEFVASRKNKGIKTNIYTRRQAAEQQTAKTDDGDRAEENIDDEDINDEDLDDDELFANPRILNGNRLIKLAERYSNEEITNRTAAADPSKRVKATTNRSWYSKINRALKARASATGESIEALRTALYEARKSNGVQQHNYKSRSKQAGATKIEDDNLDYAGETTEDDDDGDEVTDPPYFGTQHGFTPDAVEAANGLLTLSNDPQVVQAALTLMAMVESDAVKASSETDMPAAPEEGGLEDTEMTNA